MNLRKGLQLAAVYIGAVMGAGFASGQELLRFFVVYGGQGLYGLLVATLLFILFGLSMVHLIQKWQVISYQEFLVRLFGPFWGRLMEGLTTLSLPIGLLVMLAGAGAVAQEHLGFSPVVGTVATAGIVYLALYRGYKGILTINAWLIPAKVLICFLVVGWILGVSPESPVAGGVSKPVDLVVDSWLASAVLYVSFNQLLALVVMASVGREISRGSGPVGAVLGGLGLGAFATAISAAMLKYYPHVGGFEVPMVYLASLLNPLFHHLYALILWLAMITAAVGSAYGFTQRMVELSGMPYRWLLIGLLIAAVPFSLRGFSSLVAALYPLFGYLGLPLLAALFIAPLKELRGRLLVVMGRFSRR